MPLVRSAAPFLWLLSAAGFGACATGSSHSEIAAAGNGGATGGQPSLAGASGVAGTAAQQQAGTAGMGVAGAGVAGSTDAGAAGQGGSTDNVDVWSTPSAALTARTPPMGWNSWNAFHCNIDAAAIMGVADALVSSGMKDAGYEFVNIDDCWADHRDAQGNIVAGSNFPNGIKSVVDYIHGKGLKAGIYTTVGDQTCAGRPGSRGFTTQDAKTYASWGVDYAKIDWCGVQGDAATNWREWQTALGASGREMVFSICTAGFYDPWNWAPEVGNLWRTTNDINPNWAWILQILDLNQPLASLAKPGAWNDPDMLEVGNGVGADQIVTDAQNKTHLGLWAIMAAPLIAGNDLRSMSAAVQAILTNKEVIAVDQDLLGYQGYRVRKSGDLEVWMKPLEGNAERAVALFNRGTVAADIQVSWSELGLHSGVATVRDLWAHSELGEARDTFKLQVDPQATALLKISGSPPELPHSAAYLSDLDPTYASNYWGPIERNQSNGEQNPGDGHPLSIAKTTFTKGVGVHAGSLIRYRLGGRCTSFSAQVGVDDEVTGVGSVRFQVFTDGALVADSGILRSGAVAKTLNVDLSGKQELKLLASNANDGNLFDHADWAEALVECAP
jgi:alpha-galactosidase